MLFKIIKNTFIIFAGLLCFVVIFESSGLIAAVNPTMSSTNYEIESDSINFAGGHSASDNYLMYDTLGEFGAGESASTNFTLRAGFQYMQLSAISMTAPEDVVMSPDIGGISGGEANGSVSVTVTTDNPAGYSLFMAAENSPALQNPNNDSFADYVPATSNADYAFAVGTSDSVFGFSPEGSDIVSRYLSDSGSCGSGIETENTCWDGLSTSNTLVSSRQLSNHPSGVETTVKFRAGVGISKIQPPGTYTAKITFTAVSL